jgi:hypothetical protein
VVDGQVLYNEIDHYPSENQPIRVGEEPYVIFDWINGQVGGTWIDANVHWCCGEKVGPEGEKQWDLAELKDVYLKPFEPDEDDEGEEHRSQLPTVLSRGFQVFPEQGLNFEVIDQNYGFLLALTLMERDFDRLELEYEEPALGDVLGLMADLVVGGVTQNWGKLAGGIKGLAELAYRQENPESKLRFVEDPDDYIGTDVWRISRDKAKSVTSEDGVYPFWVGMPSKIWTSYTPGTWVINQKTREEHEYGTEPHERNSATMETIQYFCLVREGVDESRIKDLCSPDKAHFEQIVKPELTPEIKAYLEEVRANRDSN